ncbi:MAG: C45 family peptidase, partial [archaeon]
MKQGIKFVSITAKNNEEFGYKLGKALKNEIQDRLKKNKAFYIKKTFNGKDFSKLIEKSKKFLPATKKYFPHLLIEAEAMAKGAEVPFEELFVLMCDEEILDFKVYPTNPLHCTSVAIRTKDKRILISHNEDWFPEYRKNGLALVNGKIGKNKFIGLGYIGQLAGTSCGFNSSGIAHTDNSLVFKRVSKEVPRSFHLRALLDVKSPNEARKILNTSGSIVSSTMIISSNHDIMNIEELWTKDILQKAKDWFIHTNHPLDKKNQNKENTIKESVVRYNKAKEILENAKELNIETLKKITTDHPSEICSHIKKKNPSGYTVTVASVIMN